MTNEVCQNYASALYDLLSPSQRDDALQALGSLIASLRENAEFQKFLCSYAVSAEEKRKALDDVFGKPFSPIPHLLSFLKVISDHHRFGLLPEIYSAYRALVHEAEGVKEGLAYSATRLDEDQLAAVEAAVAKKLGCKVCLTNVVDHRLLGGVKVAIDGKVYDGTLANKLAGLHRTLHGGIPS